MSADTLLLNIALILISARVFGEIALRFNAPALIGEICAGILLGPSLLDWVQPNQVLSLLAEIGIILLLFEVGVEAHLDKLVSAGRKSTAVALIGFILPFLLGFLTSYWLFSLPVLVSLYIGGTITATSIGITVRVLADLGKQHSREGQVALGAAVIDDILGIFLLAILYEFSKEGFVSLSNIGLIALYVAVFLLLAPLAAKLLAPLLKHHHKQSQIPGLIPAAFVSLVLLFAWFAHLSGAPELLGGFVAGVAFSRRFFLPLGALFRADEEFTKEISSQMKPIIQLFTPVFFVSVGLSLNFSEVDWGSLFIWLFSLVLVTVAIIGKLMSAAFIKESVKTRIAIGMAMVPRGEVGLIFAELGRSTGVFDHTVYAGIILVIAYTTLASPLWIRWFYKHYPKLERNKSRPGD